MTCDTFTNGHARAQTIIEITKKKKKTQTTKSKEKRHKSWQLVH